MEKFNADVIIAGAGPSGLMLAGELRLQGISVLVLDRLTRPMRQSRALGFSARTIEEFGQRGLLEHFGELETIPGGHFGGIPLDYTIVDGGNFGVRGVPQSRTEAILHEWATGLGAEIRRGHEVTGLTQDEDGVRAEVVGPDGARTLRAAYLIGCDGARSAVRRLSGIGFPGVNATIEMKMADVTGVQVRIRPTGEVGQAGMVVVLPLGPQATRVVVFERGAGVRPTQEPPAFDEVAAAFQRVTGEDIGGATPLWTSCFTDASRQADAYRKGRVFLAGDAAHIHLPIGAQGISAAVGDVVNLGWKLAAEIKGHAPDGLLDTYHTERQPVGARVIQNTLVQRTLYLGGPEAQPLRDLFGELVRIEQVRRHLVGLVTGLDITYGAAPGGHPLLGRRLPEQDLVVGDAKTTTYELLHAGRPVLLDMFDDGGLRETAAPWADRVDVVTAVRAEAGAPAANLLVRPDGYVAWASGSGSDEGLTDALAHWFGAPRAAV
ncbi:MULTISPECIES: FAD-dependent monooxygenase [unclassified Streptomyces]|uniref:FAD-dependent monooxygenase n=1 Tax=unclassified Streptomyces TaxID=2593676 RepID=UPI0016607165|nr:MULTISPECIES: FAD-dependent monooxygenase [unclassified Streptomyces]MBD0707895.1 monooxygenase [Streptomyces sp. CBMA291]MBD0717596.1 monooxygenase [Streptomyces sp. CBMA370]